MRVGILADAHGNADAVRYAADRLRGRVDRLLMVGDAMDQYRFSNEVIELVRERGMVYIQGNHERSILSPHGERARGAAHVKPELLEFLRTVPLRLELDLGGKRLLMVHGSPWPPNDDYIYPGSPLLKRLDELGVDYVVLGHTHVRMAIRAGRTLIINPGSVGEARDHSDGRKLSYALLDTGSDEVVFEYFDDPSLPPALLTGEDSFT
jgi:putative phosphoesterase